MTRILHVLDHSLPMHSGYTFRTRAIMKAQAAQGLEVRGITGLRHTEPGPLAETTDDLLFHRALGDTSGPPGMREWREICTLAAAIEELAKDWRPDVLHAHSPALCGMAALRAGRRLGIPVVYEIRAFWEDAAVENGASKTGSLRYRLTRALENHVVTGADAAMTICNGLRDDLVGRGMVPEKIGVMPNGVDLSLFGEVLQRDAVLAEMLEIGGGPVIGFIGSFYDYEGIDLLIEAMPHILARHADARLLLVGGGPMDGVLREQADRSPAAGAIRFTGRVPHGEVKRYYSLCDIMAFPRRASRLTELVTPLKPLEAMAQGKLVAASDVGGHRELIRHGRTGILFPAGDPRGCAHAIAELIVARDRWSRMKKAGRAYVAEHHDWARNVRNYQPVYQAVLGIAPDTALAAAA
jgi:PEP-CTERM/exosortase A-associated glycosyltransferase